MRDLIDLFEGLGHESTLDHLLKWQHQLHLVVRDMDDVEHREGKIENVSALADCISKVAEVLDAYIAKEQKREDERRAEAERLDREGE